MARTMLFNPGSDYAVTVESPEASPTRPLPLSSCPQCGGLLPEASLDERETLFRDHIRGLLDVILDLLQAAGPGAGGVRLPDGCLDWLPRTGFPRLVEMTDEDHREFVSRVQKDLGIEVE